MNGLIKVDYTNDRPTVLGRELHKMLEVETRYNDWFSRMKDYGFSEGTDFYSILSKTPEGGRPATDHQLTIEMAKEIAMLQRTEKGKQVRQYFIQLEKDWNSPEMITKRAMEILDRKVKALTLTTLQQEQRINELQPKAIYYDLILQNKSLISMTVIAKDYGMSAKTLNKKLYELGVQYKAGAKGKEIWLLYAKYQDKGYTSSKPSLYVDHEGNLQTSFHTYWTQKGRLFIYDLLKSQGILPLIEREQEHNILQACSQEHT